MTSPFGSADSATGAGWTPRSSSTRTCSTYAEIREQRVRWCRAVHHNQARHGPYRAGIATPKVWFNQTQQFFKSTFAPARLMLPLYLLMTAVFEGTERNVILVFMGGYVVGEIVFMGLQALLTAGYRQTRHFGWVVLWPFWHEFLMVFATEAWISMPGRPIGLHRDPTGDHHPGGDPLMRRSSGQVLAQNRQQPRIRAPPTLRSVVDPASVPNRPPFHSST